jgi:hypothetical protein
MVPKIDSKVEIEITYFGNSLIGGFSQLRYSVGAKYPSELVEGGLVGWTMVSSVNHRVGPIGFRNIRFESDSEAIKNTRKLTL